MPIDALSRICATYVDDFPVCGAAISTIGSLYAGETVAASDAVAARLDEIQLDLGEGPGWDAVRSRGPVLVDDVREAIPRWPLFADEATRIAVDAVYAFPLRVGGLDVGVVGLHNSSPGPLPVSVVDAIRRRSTGTALELVVQVLVDGGTGGSDDPHSRRVIHQATGMIVARHRTTPGDALLLLRAHAFALGRTVADVAEEIADRRSGFPPPPSEI
ncbi:GAF and ANTAR domain-containing protein [Rathayibacter sp. VKM Ac-2754]|uniref:GAF and ANTAR domain-containing protein n=1 Tax=Rathayibacter sp. VKM Ac-2754 TaxID=2609251 RepID=UPI0013581D75|nr:GAF and ANTAR domain-containing protein [Rathayibacter sp. VKM Ac-2754]MWV59602.1 ANTAR domain-containing protein [Rathayibacter sp. VKM Ac-2754]